MLRPRTTQPTLKRSPLAAHVWPLGLFLGCLLLAEVFSSLGRELGAAWLADPKYWLYPLQSFLCAAALVFYWKFFDFGAIRWSTALVAGVVALLVWIAPQEILDLSSRTKGFDPTPFAENPLLYWSTVVMRFVRLVLIVPLVEEIFWRGFLMRYLINENFTKVAFGTYSPLSFFGVAAAFMLVHAPADWPAALVTGILFGWVAVRTRSLFACVLAHATTNLLLGFYIMATRQWGFW